MFDAKTIDDMTQKLYQSLPSSLKEIENDIQQKFRQVLQSTFSHFDLVSREEFDVQMKVLERMRDKIDKLEQKIDLLINK